MITRLGWLISGQDHISIAQIIHTEIILNLVCVGVHLVVHAIKGALLCLMRYSLVGPEDPVHGGAADQQDTRTQQEPLKGQSVRQSVSQSDTRTQQEPHKGQSVSQTPGRNKNYLKVSTPVSQSVSQTPGRSKNHLKVSQSVRMQPEPTEGQSVSQDEIRTTWGSVSQSARQVSYWASHSVS